MPGTGREPARQAAALTADAVVFVADSRATRREDNRGALEVARTFHRRPAAAVGGGCAINPASNRGNRP